LGIFDPVTHAAAVSTGWVLPFCICMTTMTIREIGRAITIGSTTDQGRGRS
jgi:hypothetical protein